jgi:hypothetical protein
LPIYVFACEAYHREEKFLRMDERDTPQKCSVCAKPSKRKFVPFGITTEHASKQLYEFEREKWALATGEKHQTAGDVEKWALERGKTILSPGETVKKSENLPSDREIEKALNKVYSENHSLGDVG